MFQMRMNDLEWARLQGEAEKREMTITDLVRSRLKGLIGPAGSSGGQPMPVGTVDLPWWLGRRLRLPTAVARLYVEAGRVTIDGEPFRDLHAPKGKLERVELDGEPV
jgi:hypothetical protein